MLGRPDLKAFLLGLLWTVLACAGAWADDGSPDLIKTTVIATLDPTVIVTLDGETVDDAALHRGANGEIYVDAMPIFQTLGNAVDFDAERSALIVRRSQDGVVMELHTETGIVSADGKPLGALPGFGDVASNRILLTPNAVAVLSGAAGAFDRENNRFDFELDPRLRVATGFDIWVDGVPLGRLSPEPKTVGPILLLPLEPVAEALGHRVERLDRGTAIRVIRAQDSAVFTLDLGTGVVSLHDRPIGVSEDTSYIDPVRLLLPVGVFETLTGTSVTPGEDGAIHIDLDSRLGAAVGPDGTVDELVAGAPLTIEYAEFEVSPQSVNRINIAGHVGGFNGVARVELVDLPRSAAELEPDWLSLDFEHISGIRGRLGDISADRRELDGVGLRRLRGIAGQRESESGEWAFAFGTPAASRRRISDRQFRQTFKGLAGGVRYADEAGWEAGLSVHHDPDTEDSQAVLSAISGRLGRDRDRRVEWNASGDLGVFSGPSRRGSVDLRARGQVRMELRDNVRLDTSLRYSGAEFTRTLLRAEDLRRLEALQRGLDVEEPDAARIPDVRRAESDALALGANVSAYSSERLGPLDGLSVSVGASHDRAGLVTAAAGRSAVDTLSVSATTRIAALDTSVTAGATTFKASGLGESEASRGSNLHVSAYREFEHLSLRGQANVTRTDITDTTTTASITAMARSVELALPRAAGVNIRPTVTATRSQGDWTVRGGIFAAVNSGDWLGEETRASASLGIIQSMSARSGTRTNRFLNVDVSRQVPIGDNMSVGLGYRADLRGDHDLRLLVQGRYDFNRVRRLQRTEDDAGLLQGEAFIDENNDGIRQPGETGAGGVIVRVQGTPWALRTDVSGAYAVRNLRRGLYQIGIDNRSLPLGYGLAASARTSVTIRPGHVTTLDLPVARFGQLRGSVYVDADGSGAFERGEARPEGVSVEILDDTGARIAVTASTAFGQFAFDELPIGQYTLRKVGDVASSQRVDLSEYEGGMARLRLALAGDEVRVVDATSTELSDAIPAPPTTGLPPP